jgi:hypothetical protein
LGSVEQRRPGRLMAYTVTQLNERGGAAYGVMVTLGSSDLRARRER